MTTSPQELHSRIAGYLARGETLDDFHAWFTGVAVALGRGESDAHKLVDAVDGLFVRLSEQELTEAEFDEALRHLLPVIAVFRVEVEPARGYVTRGPGTSAVWQTNATREQVSA